jgi:hypothetical protein
LQFNIISENPKEEATNSARKSQAMFYCRSEANQKRDSLRYIFLAPEPHVLQEKNNEPI